MWTGSTGTCSGLESAAAGWTDELQVGLPHALQAGLPHELQAGLGEPRTSADLSANGGLEEAADGGVLEGLADSRWAMAG